MKKNGAKKQTTLFLIAAAVFLALLIGILAAIAAHQSVRTGITLPEQSSSAQDPVVSMDPGEGFLAVTPENAPDVAATLTRPSAYHQLLRASVNSGTDSAEQTIELWELGGIRRISVTEKQETRCILTDGVTAYVWYADTPKRIEAITLPEDVSADDLSGILTYESVVALPRERILEACYLQLAELNRTPCLYVRASEENGAELHCWVDLSTGLLCRAGIGTEDSFRYELTQTGLELLQDSDVGLTMMMLLPDGNYPFRPTGEG